MEKPKTLTAALCLIYTKVGAETMKNPNKLLAVFLDLAPNLKAERNQLQILSDSGCMKNLSVADALPPAEVKALVSTCVDSLGNYYGMDRKKAEELCYTYVKALNGVTYVPSAERPKEDTKTGNGSSDGGKASGVKSSGCENTSKSGNASYHYGKGAIIQDTLKAKGNNQTPHKESTGKDSPWNTKEAYVYKEDEKSASKQSDKAAKSAKSNSVKRFVLKFFVLLLIFIVTGAASAGAGLATPMTNACFVTFVVALIMICYPTIKKKK